MKNVTALIMIFACLGVPMSAIAAEQASEDDKNVIVLIETNKGNITLELYPHKAPVSVKNFMDYAKAGVYDGTIFHRVIPGFMIQGGGYEPGMKKRETREPIENEADNGLKNEVGTVAMARTPSPHSATAQFFINVSNNEFLNFTSESKQGWGYAVFGRVTVGMDTVRSIEQAATGSTAGHRNLPHEHVVIKKVVQTTRDAQYELDAFFEKKRNEIDQKIKNTQEWQVDQQRKIDELRKTIDDL